METLFEIIKIILPTIITGIITFLITKYTYNKNKPLDKLEIAYNRVYYPIYKLIKTDNINLIISKTKLYVDKYYKYIDKSTLNSFYYLYECKTNTKRKAAYKNFKNNIYDKNSYLRRRLGYLEPNILQIYTYLSGSEKSTLRILLELSIIYVSLGVASFTKDKIQSLFVCLIIILIIIIVLELVYKMFLFFYYKIRK
ncbi:MAG: hypothetical protein ACI4EJ_10440 [Bacteroides sp.]